MRAIEWRGSGGHSLEKHRPGAGRSRSERDSTTSGLPASCRSDSASGIGACPSGFAPRAKPRTRLRAGAPGLPACGRDAACRQRRRMGPKGPRRGGKSAPLHKRRAGVVGQYAGYTKKRRRIRSRSARLGDWRRTAVCQDRCARRFLRARRLGSGRSQILQGRYCPVLSPMHVFVIRL